MSQEQTKHNYLETIYCSALPLQNINHIQRCHDFPSRMLSVSHGISDDVLEEVPQHPSDFFGDIPTDSFHAPSTGQPPNGGLGDTLDVLAHNLSMTLGTTLRKTLPSLASPGHSSIEIILH
jgi:hypothetical protein